jgi:hypothetical protein
VCTANAQNTQDASLWAEFTLEKKITKKFSLAASPNIRINQNFGDFNSFFTDFSAQYKFKGPFSASVNFRKGWNRNVRHQMMGFSRGFIDLNFKKKILPKVTFIARLRYQEQIGAYRREADWNQVRKTIRFRWKIQPKWNKRTVPSIANEFFYRINAAQRGLTRIRVTGGIDYEIDKKKSIGFYYTFQKALLMSLSVDHIYGITFNLTI